MHPVIQHVAQHSVQHVSHSARCTLLSYVVSLLAIPSGGGASGSGAMSYSAKVLP